VETRLVLSAAFRLSGITIGVKLEELFSWPSAYVVLTISRDPVSVEFVTVDCKLEIPPKQTPFHRVKLTPYFRAKVTPHFRVKLTPVLAT